jgi:glycosyltransferase involved in cell wall biosynthesis
MKKISLIIPAYNEEHRIKHTLKAYKDFFADIKDRHNIDSEIIVVLNGCTDNTKKVVQEVIQSSNNCRLLELPQAGKGRAIRAGFADALMRDATLIGFVDADMATEPHAFYKLIKNIDHCDGVIASRYIDGAQIYPPRPWIKRWGSRLIYESLVRLLFGLRYHDLQCGAKLFTRPVILKVTPRMTMPQWAFDVELLYLCKKNGFKVKEIPTTWYDRDGSKLRIRSGFVMLGSLVKLRLKNSRFGKFFGH